MANVRSANTFYIDTVSTADSGELRKPIRVYYVIVTNAAAAVSELVLKDSTTGNVKLDLRADYNTVAGSQMYNFADYPVIFPNGLNPTTVTNCTATIVFDEQKG